MGSVAGSFGFIAVLASSVI